MQQIKNLILKDCSISNNYPTKGIVDDIYSQKDYDMADFPGAGDVCGWLDGVNIVNSIFIGSVSASGYSVYHYINQNNKVSAMERGYVFVAGISYFYSK